MQTAYATNPNNHELAAEIGKVALETGQVGLAGKALKTAEDKGVQDGTINADVAFDPGSPEEVVIVRAFYPLELSSLFPSAMGLDAMGNMADGDRMLVSTAAFRNEPYL